MRNFFKDSNKPLIFSWVLVILTLTLILKSGLYSDDIKDLEMRKSMGPVSFLQMLHATYVDIIECIKFVGRFTPVDYLEQSLIFWFSNSVLTFKVIIWCINLLAVYTFTRFLKCFEMKEWIPFALLIYCATSQFYINYHDAFTSLHAMYPFLAVLIFYTIILFKLFLENDKSLTLIGTVLLATLTIFYCEVGFVIYPILLLLLINDKRLLSRKFLVFLPFAVLLIVYIVVFILVRRNTEYLYSGVTPNFVVSKMYETFLYQVRAAIPMSHFTGMYAIPQFLLDQLRKIYPLVLLCLIAFIGLLFYARKDIYRRIESKARYILLLIGLILLLFPACLLMITIKYQEQLGYGIGYLPVYIQDFGFVILMLVLFSFIFSKLGSASIILKNILFILFFVISVCTLLQNNSLIDKINNDRATPSIFYYNSLKNGILKDCEDGSVIVLRTDYFWKSAFAYQFIIDNFYKRRFQVIAEENFKGVSPEDKRHFYMLEHNKDGQFTLLYRIFPNETKVIKRINYPTGKDFNYFDLISTPL